MRIDQETVSTTALMVIARLTKLLTATNVGVDRSTSNEKVVARFQREMRLVGRLDHPHVVRAFDADRINKTLFIVM